MKNYFLISEFAKLRGININSLRYYEKLGILKPAYIDENTNYRYYSVEQISLLNKIIFPFYSDILSYQFFADVHREFRGKN